MATKKDTNKIKQVARNIKQKRYDAANEYLLNTLQEGYSFFADTLAELWQIDATSLANYVSNSQTQDFFRENSQLSAERVLMVLHNYSGKPKTND